MPRLTERLQYGSENRKELRRLGTLGYAASHHRMQARWGEEEENFNVRTRVDLATGLTWSDHMKSLLLEDSEIPTHEATHLGWSAHLREILCGTRDLDSPLSILGGMEDTIVRSIYTDVVSGWKNSVTRTMPAHNVGRMHAAGIVEELPDRTDNVDCHGVDHIASVFIKSPYNYTPVGCTLEDRPRIAFSGCGTVHFPEPSDYNVNMMPFVLGDRTSLPTYLHSYYNTCVARCPYMPDEIGKVCYLTVAEGYVLASDTQRREGLHVEAPGSHSKEPNFVAGIEHRWGCGVSHHPDELHGGLFMASNMHQTCAVWNALVDTESGAVDDHGGMDHLRPFLGPATKLAANELVWLTDKTPHEALPQAEDGYRQFFRVVTSGINLWFEEHSTPNPNCPLPKHVRIIRGNKFELG